MRVNLRKRYLAMREVFLRLRSANLKLNPKKCQLFAQEVPYVGHIIGRNGITTDPERF